MTVKSYKEWMEQNPDEGLDFGKIASENDENYHKLYGHLPVIQRAEDQKQYLKVMKLGVSTDARKTVSDWLWLTVNPKEYSQLFVRTCHEAMALKIFDQGSYVFEQRGTAEGDYKGFHFHALMHKTASPSIVKRELNRKFMQFVGNPLHVRATYVAEDQLEKIRKYMSGQKKDIEKEPKAMNDINMRKHYKLNAIYLRGPESNLLGSAKIRIKLK